MPSTKGHNVHVVPMLSPVLEDFVPPLFRGNVPDEQSPTTSTAVINRNAPAPAFMPVPTIATEAPTNWYKESHRKALGENESKASSAVGSEEDGGSRSRVSLMLHHWRRKGERGPVQVPVQKPVQVQGLPRQREKKKRSVGHYLNPFSLLAKLRDTYIQMMNGVATSGIVASGGPVGDSSAQQSTLFFSREFDSESIVQLKELQRNGSESDSDYRLKMASARNSSRVKPFSESRVLFPGEPAFARCKSTRNHADLTLFATTRSGRRLSGDPGLTKSKSNTFSDEIFFSQKLKGSRKKKLYVNPYADSDWKADAIPRQPKVESKGAGPNDFFFQRENRNAGTESRTEFRLQQSASTGSLFVYKQ